MATDSFADAVASCRYLRNNAMTPVHIRKKDITAPIISSRSSLRKSGSINCCLRMNHLQLHSDLPSAGQKTRSSNTLNSRFAILANIKQKLTKCEHREDASPVMPAQQRPPISHQKRRGASMIQFVCDSCGRVKEPSETWIVGTAAEAVGVTAARREVTIQSAWDRAIAVHPFAVHFCSIKCKDSYMAELFAADSAAEERIVERTAPAEILVERNGPVQRITTRTRKVHRTKRAA